MTKPWSLEGTYFETCNCEAACPCVFLNPPTEGECTALVAWHIDKGNYDSTSLGGLNVAIALHSPGSMVEVPWKAAVYLDDRATQPQVDALTQIFSGQAGGHPGRLAGHIGEVLGLKSAPIDYQMEGKRWRLRIGDVATADIEALSGQNNEPVKIENHPLAIAPGHPAVVAKSKQFIYHDHGFAWEMSNRNGFYSPFTYRGP
jgi:hypothetical protein